MTLQNVSPIDGRYAKISQELSPFFSESALMKYRLMVEIEYVIKLSEWIEIEELPEFSEEEKTKLRAIYENFDEKSSSRIKEIESVTNHDVKAIEYFIKENIQDLELSKTPEFIHFALTSEDINNLSFTLMHKESLEKVLLPKIESVLEKLVEIAEKEKATPFLALTHGQTATPTTFGKEIAVFVYRLQRQIRILKKIKETFFAKFGGATGTWSAHKVAYPDADWLKFATEFTESFGLEFNPLTTQIVPADSLSESFDTVKRINTILIDFSRDIWLYVMRGVLGQENKKGEIGSSAMPHKINPINFENAEGNFGMANSILNHLSMDLMTSRMQRDLTGSTVMRNQGVGFGYSLIALENLLKGLSRVKVNRQKMDEELENHKEVLAEGIQNILRKLNYPNPYEALKDLTRGEKVTDQTLLEFIQKLEIPETEKEKLRNLKPQNYIGLSEELVSKIF